MGIGREGFPSFDDNVLSVGSQLYVLLDAVGYKDDRIDDENGIVLIGRIDIGFYKYISVVYPSDFDIGEIIARHTVHIDMKARMFGIGKFDGRAVQLFLVPVVNAE